MSDMTTELNLAIKDGCDSKFSCQLQTQFSQGFL